MPCCYFNFEKGAFDGEKPEGEYVIIRPPEGKKPTDTSGLFDSLMKFQYGDAEESDAGFEEMMRIAEDPWAALDSVDDLVMDQDLVKLIETENTIRCPHLKKLGKFFYYCSGGIKEGTELKIEPSNIIIQAKQETAQLQLHCMDRYEACCHYNGSLPFPGAECQS